MRRFRRSIYWLLPVICIPLVAMLVMQYRFLRTLESKTASAQRNWLRGAVENVALEIESHYRTAANRALTVPTGALDQPEMLAAHFVANPVAGAKTSFLVRFREGNVRYDLFDGAGVPKMIAEEEMQAIKLASVSWHVVHKYGSVMSAPQLIADERDHAHRILLRPVMDGTMRVAAVAGVVFDEKATMAAMTALGQKGLRARGANVALRVGERFPVMPRGRDYITHSLGFVFSDWRAGIRDVCASPEEMAATNFRNNVMWTGGAGVIMFGAVFLAFGATARQMKLSQMKSDFVSNVSHELRTPLASIRVFGEYLRLGRVTREEKVREYGEYIEAESRRLTQLINNILDFSKIESSEKKYKFVMTDVVSLISQTVTAFAMPLREQGFVVNLNQSTGSIPAVPVDADALAQVVTNLLDNAVKYSGDAKHVDVTIGATDEALSVAVRDRGIGIPPAEQKKIFEKFYRVGSGLVHDVKGSGLGLAIVQHVVNAHGGRVEVESAPGRGSTFTITLPKTTADLEFA
jgi:signal transduction histidine kinase